MPPGQPSQQHVFQAPTGTRDFYPQELLRRRYIEKAWRDVSIRHGFEEIDGPTFEHLDLYTVKSGEGIVSELFSFERAGGEKTYALRPEFTPTLARMYAARASSLPRPTKWFWQQNCFRAERPQRGRLREFLQWNVDVIGGEGVYADELNLEAVAVLVELLSFLGLGAEDIRVKVSDRRVICKSLERHGVASQTQEQFFALLDAREKIGAAEYRQRAHALGLPSAVIAGFDPEDKQVVRFDTDFQGLPAAEREEAVRKRDTRGDLFHEIARSGLTSWCEFDNMIVRGLAYYTDMVFEVHEAGGKERAIAGGGRYDNLIELFGGPPTPAVGFGMGDVVLSLVLQDKGLMPEGAALLEALSRPGPSLRPDVFVVAAENPGAEAQLLPTLARWRRGEAGRYPPLHARRSYKSTRNIGKLAKEADGQHARHFAVIESETACTLKRLDGAGEPRRLGLADVGAAVADAGSGSK